MPRLLTTALMCARLTAFDHGLLSLPAHAQTSAALSPTRATEAQSSRDPLVGLASVPSTELDPFRDLAAKDDADADALAPLSEAKCVWGQACAPAVATLTWFQSQSA